MATNNFPQLELQSPPCRPSPSEILANFQEIFSSQIEPDVVQLVLTECDYNENACLESLFALVGETSGGKLNKGQRDRQETTGKLKAGGDPTTEKSFYKNRISTIYKSNEGLYSEDTALNGEDLNCSKSDRFSNLPKFFGLDITTSSEKQVTGPFQLNGKSASSVPSNGTSHVDQNKFPTAQSQWNDISDLEYSEIQNSISPNSDKSIEADASEHIGIVLGRVGLKDEQLVQTPCAASLGFNVMAESEQSRQHHPHKQRTQGPAHPKRSPNKKQFNPQNSQAKTNMSTPRKKQSGQNPKTMSQKDHIIKQIEKGKRILVLLRGCPGSGKTTLAREIKFNGVIYSTDNFFVKNGEYNFDPNRLSEAHTRNKILAMRAMQIGRTPIIIDNTNLVDWEMAPYVALALQYQYYICCLEPQTPWRYDPRQLAMKTTHYIRYDKIVSMLQKFDLNITVQSMIEQYVQNNGAAARPRPDINKTQINATRPSPNYQNRRQVRRPKPSPVNTQVSPSVVHDQSINPSGSIPFIYDSSDSESDLDGWSVLNTHDFTPNFSHKPTRENLKKCKSVPNLFDSEALFTSSSQEFSSSRFEGLIPEPVNIYQNCKPEPLSENMRDLMELDFSLMHIQPNATSEQPQIPEDSLVLDDVERKKVHSGRLAAYFQNLPSEWDVPAYPAGLENSVDDRSKSGSNSPSLDDQEINSTNASEQDSNAEKPLKHAESTETENPQNSLCALKAYFSNVPDDALKDIYERCNGDLQWVASLLLDAGYEMCFDEKNPSEDLFQKSGSSLEGLAEISPDGHTGDPTGSAVADSPSPVAEASASLLISPDDRSTIDNQYDPLSLRIDPIFAMQLQEMFGPVGFHLNPVSYYGGDLSVSIPFEVARSIHTCWSESLKVKFDSEDAEIEKMMTNVAQDEDFAKRLQEEEDALLAATLQRDPLGESFPPLEIKHLVMTHEKIPPKTEVLASRIKRRQLYEMYPKIDRKALDEVFDANNACFSETVQAVQVLFCPDQKPKLVVAPEQLAEYERALVKFAEQESLLLEMDRTKKEELDDFSEPTYDDLRTEATLHYRLRQDCFSKARDAYDKGLMAAATFYSQRGQVHSEKLHEANKRASEVILEMRNVNRKSDTLDLHMLHVHEAVNALAEFLDGKKLEMRAGQVTLRIITGKGNHSAMGLPKIKPAVLDYLTKQNYSHCDTNGGLIEVYIRK